jgi:hypothetical protein
MALGSLRLPVPGWHDHPSQVQAKRTRGLRPLSEYASGARPDPTRSLRVGWSPGLSMPVPVPPVTAPSPAAAADSEPEQSRHWQQLLPAAHWHARALARRCITGTPAAGGAGDSDSVRPGCGPGPGLVSESSQAPSLAEPPAVYSERVHCSAGPVRLGAAPEATSLSPSHRGPGTVTD